VTLAIFQSTQRVQISVIGQVTRSMEVTVELISNTILVPYKRTSCRELKNKTKQKKKKKKKKTTRFKGKLEKQRLSKVFKASHIIRK